MQLWGNFLTLYNCAQGPVSADGMKLIQITGISRMYDSFVVVLIEHCQVQRDTVKPIQSLYHNTIIGQHLHTNLLPPSPSFRRAKMTKEREIHGKFVVTYKTVVTVDNWGF